MVRCFNVPLRSALRELVSTSNLISFGILDNRSLLSLLFQGHRTFHVEEQRRTQHYILGPNSEWKSSADHNVKIKIIFQNFTKNAAKRCYDDYIGNAVSGCPRVFDKQTVLRRTSVHPFLVKLLAGWPKKRKFAAQNCLKWWQLQFAPDFIAKWKVHIKEICPELKKKNFENFIKFYTNLSSFTSFSHSWNGRKGSSPRRFRNTSRFSPTSNSSAKSTSKIYQARSRCIHAICRPGSLLWNILVALLNHRSRVSLFEGELAWIQGFWNFTSEGAFCRLAIRRKFYVKILFVPLVLEVAIFRSMCKIHDHRWRLEEQNRGVWKLYFSDSYKGLKKLEDMCP